MLMVIVIRRRLTQRGGVMRQRWRVIFLSVIIRLAGPGVEYLIERLLRESIEVGLGSVSEEIGERWRVTIDVLHSMSSVIRA